MAADALLQSVCRAKRNVREAREWLQFLKDQGETDHMTIHCAINAVAMYQQDLVRLKAEARAQGREIH